MMGASLLNAVEGNYSGVADADSKEAMGINLLVNTNEDVVSKFGQAEEHKIGFEYNSEEGLEYGTLYEYYYKVESPACPVFIKYTFRKVDGKRESYGERSLVIYDANAFRQTQNKHFLMELDCKTVKTKLGLRLGLSRKQIKEIYGDPDRITDDYWEYSGGNKMKGCKISTQFRADKVIKISIIRYAGDDSEQ